jgi:hypothetical protein
MTVREIQGFLAEQFGWPDMGAKASVAGTAAHARTQTRCAFGTISIHRAFDLPLAQLRWQGARLGTFQRYSSYQTCVGQQEGLHGTYHG